MTVACLVEGPTDYAFIEGLRERWCPEASLDEIRFRGSRVRHRDYPKFCANARLKDADMIVILTDASDRDWRKVREDEAAALAKSCTLDCLIGVCDRNVECWLCSDPAYAAKRLRCEVDRLAVQDPKSAFEAAMGIDRERKCETEIIQFVREAPVREWLRRSESFRAFYRDARDIAQRRGCPFPNEEARL